MTGGEAEGRRAGTASLQDLVGFLDGYLRIREVPDHPNAMNGLQVENRGSVGWIAAAVDASQATIDAVAERSAARGTPALLIVHHGLFWDGAQPLTGRRMRRARALLAADTALYGAHIPLDVHPEVGNNAVLARELGLTDTRWFSDYRGILLGISGALSTPREALVAQLDRMLATSSRLIAGGPEVTRRVGVITGAAGDRIRDALDAGCDTLVTGEGMHHTYFDAMEYGVNVVYAGHYATETVGVKAAAALAGERFGLPHEFVDLPTGL